jgi:hypothetical protein
VAILIGFTVSASASALTASSAETGNMMLIGAGLIVGASITRRRTRRG